LAGAHDDKAMLVGHLVATESLDASQCVMIGDRKHDVIGAANNGIAAIGVIYGYGGRTELTEAGAKHLVVTPAEITALID
ncbi:MAG: HAD hydrolase-like protein, partial [Hyphomicrobiales bacterium]|nr:HAD hydrolase-like protein [Hyphomicrobiales bacterium]